MDVGKRIVLHIDGFVTLDELELNGGLLQIMTPHFVTIGDVNLQDGGSLFIETESILCPRLDYRESVYVSMKRPNCQRWTSVELCDVRGSSVSFSKEGSLQIHHFIDYKPIQYVKR